ncbi:hypothetical protein BKA64DRAFT_749758 [Cadophora sp. MPI-SDFR-AT-0126]|nr:hypothetical protein BKA64DRAFT_749758 [Leotiomycetes sp. MPI-SDFR-AT-0126]
MMAEEETQRQSTAQGITEALENLSIKKVKEGTDDKASLSSDANADDSDPEDRIRLVRGLPPTLINSPKFSEDCPRYNEIKMFLIANRAEQKLALDTMGLLSESVFYRHIREISGITITTREWDPFPGPGLVVRVSAGWPPTPAYVNNREYADENCKPTKKAEDAINMLMRNPKVHHLFYDICGEARDVDIRYFRFRITQMIESLPKARAKYANYFEVSESEFHDLIVWTAGTPDGKGNPNFT